MEQTEHVSVGKDINSDSGMLAPRPTALKTLSLWSKKSNSEKKRRKYRESRNSANQWDVVEYKSFYPSLITLAFFSSCFGIWLLTPDCSYGPIFLYMRVCVFVCECLYLYMRVPMAMLESFMVVSSFSIFADLTELGWRYKMNSSFFRRQQKSFAIDEYDRNNVNDFLIMISHFCDWLGYATTPH